MKGLTLFGARGGLYGPDNNEKLFHFYRIRGRPPKILDFVPSYVWMVPWESFVEIFYWNFWKIKNISLTVLTSKGPPFEKKIRNFKNNIFLQKNDIFSLWIYIVHVLSFLLRYITITYMKFSNFDQFLIENFNF